MGAFRNFGSMGPSLSTASYSSYFCLVAWGNGELDLIENSDELHKIESLSMTMSLDKESNLVVSGPFVSLGVVRRPTAAPPPPAINNDGAEIHGPLVKLCLGVRQKHPREIGRY